MANVLVSFYIFIYCIFCRFYFFFVYCHVNSNFRALSFTFDLVWAQVSVSVSVLYVSLALAVCLLLFIVPSSVCRTFCLYEAYMCMCVGVYVNVFVCCLFVSLNGKFKLPFNLSLSPLWLSPVGSPARLLDILGPFCRGEFIEETETLAVHRYPCAHIWPKGRGLDDMLTLCQQANWRILI